MYPVLKTWKSMPFFLKILFMIFLTIIMGCKENNNEQVSLPIQSASTAQIPTSATSTRRIDETLPTTTIATSTDIEQYCTIKTDTPPNFELDGYLILERQKQIRILGGQPPHELSFEKFNSSDVTSVGISPNGRWFAYYTGSLEVPGDFYRLHITEIGGTAAFAIDENKDLVSRDIEPLEGHTEPLIGRWIGVKWLSNDVILVPILIGYEGRQERFLLANVNPFEGTWSTELNNLPNYDHLHGTLSLSPDSTRLMYVSTITSTQFTQNQQPYLQIRLDLNLMELLTQENVWELPLVGFGLQNSGPMDKRNVIAWSPDNKRVAFSNITDTSTRNDQEGLYLLNTEDYNLSLISSPPISVSESLFTSLSWSFDGKYLAYQHRVSIKGRLHDLTTELRIYDVANGKIHLVCPIDDELADYATPIVWSPNGNQLAFMGQGYSGSDQLYHLPIHILDISRGQIISNISEGKLVGWSEVMP